MLSRVHRYKSQPRYIQLIELCSNIGRWILIDRFKNYTVQFQWYFIQNWNVLWRLWDIISRKTNILIKGNWWLCMDGRNRKNIFLKRPVFARGNARVEAVRDQCHAISRSFASCSSIFDRDRAIQLATGGKSDPLRFVHETSVPAYTHFYRLITNAFENSCVSQK